MYICKYLFVKFLLKKNSYREGNMSEKECRDQNSTRTQMSPEFKLAKHAQLMIETHTGNLTPSDTDGFPSEDTFTYCTVDY